MSFCCHTYVFNTRLKNIIDTKFDNQIQLIPEGTLFKKETTKQF